MKTEPSPRDQRGGVVMAVLMPHAPVLVPAIAGQRSGEVAATTSAMREAARRVVAAQPDSLVAVSPHSPRQPGAFGIWSGVTLHGSLAQFGAPKASVDFPPDPELSAAIVAEAKSRGVTTRAIAEEPLDHGAVVPLWFVAEAGWCGPTVLFSLNYPREGGLRELGEAIAAGANKAGRAIAFLASGDMSHRLTPDAPAGFHPRGHEFDREFVALVQRGAYRELPNIDAELQERAAEDVLDSTIVAVAATDWNSTRHEWLSYEGPFGVGYGVAVLYEEDRSNACSNRHFGMLLRNASS